MVKHTRLLVVERDGVEDDLADAVAVSELDEADVKLARVVARIGVEGGLVGVAFHVECSCDLDEVGVGVGIKKPVNDGHLLVVGIEVDVGRARNQNTGQCEKQEEASHRFCFKG